MSEGWFGARRPGATEDVLEAARGGEHSPYEWVARAVSKSANHVLDLACGTGNLSQRLRQPGRTVVGVDPSRSNLAIAQSRGEGPWVHHKLEQLPFDDDEFDAVVTVLGLGLVRDRGALLAEVARVLRPGGVFVALTPSLRPRSPADLALTSRLAGYLRVTPQVPGAMEYGATAALARVGLTKVEDARARYHYVVHNEADAHKLLAGLRAAPDRARTASAARFLGERAKSGPVSVPLPLRRLSAIK